ncbi:hypothetical protein AURDEDRAFT_130391 [Auricularia subglabra TFB-10046 SS5]|nr:hypothetical protein AURDEDRAFT_130391 [Auricularia subglabra TFB-10046 SS5]
MIPPKVLLVPTSIACAEVALRVVPTARKTITMCPMFLLALELVHCPVETVLTAKREGGTHINGIKPSNRRASPPVSRPALSPGADTLRPSPSPGSPDSGPGNAPSPPSHAVAQMFRSMVGSLRRQHAEASPTLQNVATPSSSATRAPQQGRGSGRGVPRAAPTVSGSSRTADASTPGPSSRAAHAQLAYGMPPGMPHAYGPYPYAPALPGPAMAHAAPPPPGHAAARYAPLPPPPPPPPPPPHAGAPNAYLPPPSSSIFHPGRSLRLLKSTKKGARADKQYYCDVADCSEPPFRLVKEYEGHMRAHYLNSNHSPFPCPYCEKEYDHRNDRVRHIKKNHPGKSWVIE